MRQIGHVITCHMECITSYYISPQMSASTETTSGVSAVITMTCPNSSLRSGHAMRITEISVSMY